MQPSSHEDPSQRGLSSSADVDNTGASGGVPHPTAPRIPDHEMLRCIGQGSYGEVWLARGTLGFHRAVKVIYRDQFESEKPFEREFEGVRHLEPLARTHDGFVDILQVGRSDTGDWFYCVMELPPRPVRRPRHLPVPVPPSNERLRSSRLRRLPPFLLVEPHEKD